MQWNVGAGDVVRVFPDSNVGFIPDLHSANTFSASADGSTLAGINVIGVLLFDAKTGALYNTIKAESQASAVALSPDGSKVAVSYFGGRVTLFDTKSGAVVRSISAYSDGFYIVRTLAYSPDGRFVACGMYKASDGHRVDGQWSVRKHNDIAVNIWDITTGKFGAALKGDLVQGTTDDSDSVWGLSWNRTGDTLAVSSLKAIRVWKASPDHSAYTLAKKIPAGAFSLSFAPDGDMAAADRNYVIVYSPPEK
jgi:WD40 repeat protein